METTIKVLRELGFEANTLIGAGKYGKVILATSDKYPNDVAIKIMDRNQLNPSIASECLPRELDIVNRVHHPHIVQVHETVETPDGQVFIVMECAAMTVVEKIENLDEGLVPIDQAKIWFSQLVSAMMYLHNQDIVHRDLKCENILLTADDQIKLTDFGFARISKGFPELSESYCGSIEYAAPEVLKREPYDPKKSEVWSLGVVLYVLVTGSFPFQASSLENLLRLQSEPPMYPQDVKVEKSCRRFISYILQFDPHTRPSVTEVAQHPWLQSTSSGLCSSESDSIDSVDQEDEGGTAASGQDANLLQLSKEERCWSAEYYSYCCNSEPDISPSQDIIQLQLREEQSGWSAEYYSNWGSNEAEIIPVRYVIPPQQRQEQSCWSSNNFWGSNETDIFQSEEATILAPELQDDSRRAGASVEMCQNVEDVGEEVGCFGYRPLRAAVERAAKACAEVVAPIVRASRSLRRRMKKLFKRKVHDISATTQEGACSPCSSKGVPACSDQTGEDELGTNRRLRFFRFKMLKKTKIHPSK